jgi:hypothetical protein
MQVLRDISSPDDGLYSVRDAMETRLSYVRWQMDNILNNPTIKVSMLGKGACLSSFLVSVHHVIHPSNRVSLISPRMGSQLSLLNEFCSYRTHTFLQHSVSSACARRSS